MREVVNSLKRLHGVGINCIMTCRVDVRAIEDDGSIGEAAPKLMSYGVSENLVAMFDDVLLVGAVTVGGKSGYALQFGDAKVSRTSKDLEGRPKKFLNFAPRITGVK